MDSPLSYGVSVGSIRPMLQGGFDLRSHSFVIGTDAFLGE